MPITKLDSQHCMWAGSILFRYFDGLDRGLWFWDGKWHGPYPSIVEMELAASE